MSIQIPLFLEIQLLNSEISNTMHLIYKGMYKSSQSQHVLKGILCKLRTN